MTRAIPDLTTERLTLRPIAPADVDFVLAHFSDPAVDRYLLDEDPVTTRADAQAIVDYFVHSEGEIPNRWVITLRGDGTPIGTCGFHALRQRDRRCDIGYDLGPRFWGHGYMSEALRAALTFGFAELSLNRVGAIVHPENAASLRLLERLGFLREGLLRDWHQRAGVFHDHVQLALLASDWPVAP